MEGEVKNRDREREKEKEKEREGHRHAERQRDREAERQSHVARWPDSATAGESTTPSRYCRGACKMGRMLSNGLPNRKGWWNCGRQKRVGLSTACAKGPGSKPLYEPLKTS
jgi:hypothetical protein